MSIKPTVFSGCLPALLTPCKLDGSPDFNALAATGAELVATGMAGVVYCGSVGEWPLLSTEQRYGGVEALVETGISVVVGTGAQNTQTAVAIARHAAENGAAGLMMIPRVLSRTTSQDAQRAHFRKVLEAGKGLPTVIYNSPYYGFETRADLFFELAQEFENLVGFKEFGGAASLSYAAEHITNKGEHLSLVVGVDTQVVHGIVRCGATGVITGIGNVFPEPILKLVDLCHKAVKGDVNALRLAHELDEALSVLSSFDEGPDLVLFFRHLMVLEGKTQYDRPLYPSDSLGESQRRYAEQSWERFRAWWDEWSATNQSD